MGTSLGQIVDSLLFFVYLSIDVMMNIGYQ